MVQRGIEGALVNKPERVHRIKPLVFPARVYKITLFDLTRFLLAVFVVLSGLKLLSFSYNIIRTPYPLELREGAILSTTHLLLDGKNPFAAENLPQYLNGYGIVYNLTAVPLARLLGDTFTTHRLLTGFYIYLAIFFLIAVTIRKKGAPLFAIAAGLCVLANQLYSVTPLTRPDGLGFLLYLGIALLPWDQNFSRRSLIISAILGVLVFFTKLYFFLAVFYVAVYLFMRVSKRLALAYVGLITVCLLAAALLVVWLFPYYFYATFFMAVYQPIYLLQHMLWQFRQLGSLYSGMLGIVFLVALGSLKPAFQRMRRFRFQQLRSTFDFWHWSKPFVSFPIDYPLMALTIAALVMAFKLGGHNGSKMVYLFQLISPFWVIVVIRLANKLTRLKFAACLLLGLALATNLRQIGIRPQSLDVSPDTLINNPARYLPNWVTMQKLLSRHSRVLNGSLIAGLLIEQDKPIIDNGHTEYFQANFIPENIFLPNPRQICQIDRNFRASVLRRVRLHEFDLVVIDRRESPFVDRETLQKYYHFDQEVDLYAIQNRAHFLLEVWSPKQDQRGILETE